MFKKNWSMREGFAIVAVLFIAGLLLQWLTGPVNWELFRWPVNGVTLAVFLILVAVTYFLRNRFQLFRFIGSYQSAIPTLMTTVVLTITMGLTRQEENGTWWNSMLTFWPFVISYSYMDVILGHIVLKRVGQILGKNSGIKIKDVAFILNHLGLFLALTTATLGNADVQRLMMITDVGIPERRALTQEQDIVEMPFAIELKKFIMETYEDGSPKRFASDIEVLTQSDDNVIATVDVNKPVEVKGWKIYQYSYDERMGTRSRTSIFELVKDPWLPAVYTGIYMMLAGALFMFIFGRREL